MSDRIIFRPGELPTLAQEPQRDDVDSALTHARRPEVLGVRPPSRREVSEVLQRVNSAGGVKITQRRAREIAAKRTEK